MVSENLASKLCSLLADQSDSSVIDAKEWRLLGQEQDGTLMLSWIQSGTRQNSCTCLGFYSNASNSLQTIYRLDKTKAIVQASINLDKNIFGYVTKENDQEKCIYKPYLVTLGHNTSAAVCDLELARCRQIMVQFLYRKQSVLSEKQPETCLVFIHQDCVLQYKLKPDKFNLDDFVCESLVRVFVWAQWDPINQTLYYIHYRKPNRGLVEGEELEITSDSKLSPTLSGLQFHDDLPHETVLNIPLNLPHLTGISSSCGVYEDDTVPLRIHDCSLDLTVLAHSKGYVCVCHHYLYQPVQPPEDLEPESSNPVHFAYSVTVLHHSCVLHCVVPEIPWNRAKTIRPFFKLYDDHMLILIPSVCTHLLDVGAMHEPCCHITLPYEPILGDCREISLAPLYVFGKNSVVNLPTLDVVNVGVSVSQLIQVFKSETLLENKLSIMHYLLLHLGEIDVATQLIMAQVEKPLSLGFAQLLKEFLIGSAYSTVQRNLPKDAYQLITLLPLTTQAIGNDIEVNVNDYQVCLSQDVLWNASMMLLSPQQRIVPYRADIWVKLWDHLAKFTKARQKFKPSQVVEKLMVSLTCYQPESLSRSSTPLSPCSSVSTSTILSDLTSAKNLSESLPFFEIESCTASKQEHIISVNLRELSMHLLKQSTENRASCFQWQSQTPMHVHAVATRYVSAQLEQSRFLCQILCKAATFGLKYEHEKGFMFIDELSEEKRLLLFTVLERYYLAAESIAFPLPQGFTSFFSFLGFRAMNFELFIQYVQRNVFELQVDVMKVIMADIEDDKIGMVQKLKLLSFLPKTRAKRLLNQWYHPVSLMVRAREHTVNVLAGLEGTNSRSRAQRNKPYKIGIAAFPSADRLSPLDTFFDLLTAKASLTELDFGLLIEATVCSTEDFI